MKYILAVMTGSYALQCLARVFVNPVDLERMFIERARKTRADIINGKFPVTRVVEAIWFIGYIIITYHELTR